MPEVWVLVALVVLLSFVLAALSWRFVERPFRRSSGRVGNARVLLSYAAALASGLAVARVCFLAAGA